MLYLQAAVRRLRKQTTPVAVSYPSIADLGPALSVNDGRWTKELTRTIGPRRVSVTFAKRLYELSIGVLITEYSVSLSVSR